MTLSPDEDFQTWAYILIDSIEEGGDYRMMLSDCSSLIFDILDSGQLSEKISEFTDSFLQNNIPAIVDKILNLDNLTGEEREDCIGFLNSVLTLCIWAINNDYSSLFSLFHRILNNQANIFYYWVKEGQVSRREQTNDYNFLIEFVKGGEILSIFNISCFSNHTYLL